MTTLTGRTPRSSYQELLKLNGGSLDANLRSVEDGIGVASPLQLSTINLAIHGLVFPTTGATAGKVLTVAANGTSMEWATASSGGGGGGDFKSDGSVHMTGTLIGTAFRANMGSPEAAGNSATMGYAFGDDGNTGMFSVIGAGGAGNGIVSLYSNGSEKVRVTGTTTQLKDFLTIEKSISLGAGATNYGSPGQVMTSTGPDTAPNWTTPASGWTGGTVNNAVTIATASPQLTLAATGGVAGPVTISTPNEAGAGAGHVFQIVPGTSTGGTAQSLMLHGGRNFAGNGGDVGLYAGRGSSYGGNVVLQSGVANSSDYAGDIVFRTGNNQRMRIGANGALSFGTTNTNFGSSGQVLVSQGSGNPPNWSNVVWNGGVVSSQIYISTTAPQLMLAAPGNGAGTATIATPAEATGNGISLQMIPGQTSGGTAQSLRLYGGRNTNGVGGSSFLYGGQGSSIGGSVNLVGGVGADANSGGSVIVTTASNERFRVRPTGGWSLGSAGTFVGTAGQVLTSQGDAPPTWANPPTPPGFNGGTITSTLAIQSNAAPQLTLGTGTDSVGIVSPTGTSSQTFAINPGTATSGKGSELRLAGGMATNGLGGQVLVTGGAGSEGTGRVRLEGGDIWVVTGGNVRLAINTAGALSAGAISSFGTAGQVLTSAGDNAPPSWTTMSASWNGGSVTTPISINTNTSPQLSIGGGSSGATITGNLGSGGLLTITPGTLADTYSPTLLVTGGSSSTGGTGGTATFSGGDGLNGGSGGWAVIQGGRGHNSTAGPVYVNGGYSPNNWGAGNVFIQGGQGGYWTTANGGNVEINGGMSGGQGGTHGTVRIATSSIERLRFLTNGAWSVGTNGTSTGNAGQALVSNGSGSAPTWQTVGTGDFKKDGSVAMTGTLTGTAFRSAIGAPNNSDLSTNGFAFGADGDTGMFSPVVDGGSPGNGVASLFSNGIETLRSLSTLVDVKVTLNVANNLTLAGSAGTIGQVLTSNGSGAAPTWTTISSGSGGSNLALPYYEVAIGSGSGVTSSNTMVYNPSNGSFTLAPEASSTPGNISLYSARGTTGVNSSNIILQTGYGDGAHAGEVIINGGGSDTSGKYGGGVSIQGGHGGSGAIAGNIRLSAGQSTGSGVGGSIEILSGTSATGTTGSIILGIGLNSSQITERLRILPNGAWSVGTNGTSTGTTGQVLTSNGNGAAPTWQTVTAAAGTISSNAPASETSPGVPGEMRYDANTFVVYLCVGPNFWRRMNTYPFASDVGA